MTTAPPSRAARFRKTIKKAGVLGGVLFTKTPVRVVALRAPGRSDIHAAVMHKAMEIAMLAGPGSLRITGNGMIVFVQSNETHVVVVEVIGGHKIAKSIQRTLRTVIE